METDKRMLIKLFGFNPDDFSATEDIYDQLAVKTGKSREEIKKLVIRMVYSKPPLSFSMLSTCNTVPIQANNQLNEKNLSKAIEAIKIEMKHKNIQSLNLYTVLNNKPGK